MYQSQKVSIFQVHVNTGSLLKKYEGVEGVEEIKPGR